MPRALKGARAKLALLRVGEHGRALRRVGRSPLSPLSSNARASLTSAWRECGARGRHRSTADKGRRRRRRDRRRTHHARLAAGCDQGSRLRPVQIARRPAPGRRHGVRRCASAAGSRRLPHACCCARWRCDHGTGHRAQHTGHLALTPAADRATADGADHTARHCTGATLCAVNHHRARGQDRGVLEPGDMRWVSCRPITSGLEVAQALRPRPGAITVGRARETSGAPGTTDVPPNG